MVIIIEGTDLVGKTSLSKLISERLEIPYARWWVDLSCSKSSMTSVSKSLVNLIRATKLQVIFDRSLISELVYGKILGRDVSYLDELINEWSTLNNCFVIILVIQKDALRKRYYHRGDGYVSLEQIIHANFSYKLVFNHISKKFDALLIDVTNRTNDDIASEIVKFVIDKYK